MIACFTYRPAPSLALLLGLAGSLAACIDPKSIGDEPDDESSGSVESGSESEGSGGATQGQTSQTSGQTSDTGDDPSSGDTDPQPCPPIDIEPCQECTCIDGGWICEPTCAPSCEGLECGAGCELCPEDDPDCVIPEVGVCTAEGQCVGTPPPKLGFCEGALQPGFEDELDAIGGCGDVEVYAHDAADERGIVIQYLGQGLVADAAASGMPGHVELSATDPALVVEGRAGFFVTIAECNGVSGTEVDIKESWLPAAGTVIIDVFPLEGEIAHATVQLVDVELHRVQPGPAPIVVNATFSDVLVGWLPG
jgi:hypothetical protein